MNGKDLLEAMGHIDEQYVEQAASVKKKKKNVWLGPLAAAACLCVAVLGWQSLNGEKQAEEMSLMMAPAVASERTEEMPVMDAAGAIPEENAMADARRDWLPVPVMTVTAGQQVTEIRYVSCAWTEVDEDGVCTTYDAEQSYPMSMEGRQIAAKPGERLVLDFDREPDEVTVRKMGTPEMEEIALTEGGFVPEAGTYEVTAEWTENGSVRYCFEVMFG